MLRPLVIADADGRVLRMTLSYTLSLAYGDDENDFRLQIDRSEAPPAGGYVFIDGTEYGGVVDAVKNSKSRTGSRVAVCSGRTWHGILAGKRLVPGPSAPRIEVSGPAGSVLGSLLDGMRLGSLFAAEPGGAAVEYSFERFVDAYSGIRSMLAANGLKLSMAFSGGMVRVSAPPVARPGMDGDLLDFDLEVVHRRVNHLVCAGIGEGEERVVVHLYADAAGRVSKEQSLFGVDEITAYYDYNNADAAELEKKGAEKLGRMQGEGSLRIEVYEGVDLDVGDVVRGRDGWLGREVLAEVRKKGVKARNGLVRLSYEAGSADAVSTSNSTISGGGSQGVGGGHAYYAGDGLKLSGYTFSAEVSRRDVDALGARADAARKDASDAAASAAAAAAGLAGKADRVHVHRWAEVKDAPGKFPPEPHRHAWGDLDGVPGEFAPAPHEHPYAASAEPGGPAASAERLSGPRRVSISGAVSGSAEWDGSSDLEIVATGDVEAAGFLAAHPVGFYVQTAGVDPAAFGGVWEFAPAIGPDTWLRKE